MSAPVVFRSSREWRIGAYLLIMMGLIFVTLGGLIWSSQHDLAALAIALAGLPWLVAAGWVWRWDARHAIELGPDSVAVVGARRSEMRLDEVVAYRFAALHLQAVGLAQAGVAALDRFGMPRGALPAGQKVALILKDKDGRTLRIDQRTERVMAIVEAVRTRVDARLLAEARQRLAETGAVTFGTQRGGPITLTASDIRLGQAAPVPLSAVRGARLLRGRLVVEGAFTLPFREVDNLFVLLKLLDAGRVER